jgi:DNA-directed RNA polymerase subunit RPC12/RpoP
MTLFPPKGYVPVASAVPGIELFMPAPEDAGPGPEVVNFKCPQCLATTAFSVTDGGLRCAHCGYYEPPSTPVVGKGARTFEFTVETVEAARQAAARQANGWGIERCELQCQNCGAETSLPPGDLTHTCPFCGSNRVLQHEAPQDQLRPRFLIPFKIEVDRCRVLAREWLSSSWMTPKVLKEAAGVGDFSGVYVPYWTFDARTTANWRAEVGHQVTESYYDAASKTWKTRTKTVWRWESGRAQLEFDDMLVNGSTKLSPVLLKGMQDFDTHDLVPYAPSYLAGLLAQAYDRSLESAWEEGRERMRARTKDACQSQASTKQIRNFSMSLDFTDESYRYVLVPLYLAAYRYEGETYQVMINGQTGTIAGQRPVDWTKVGLAIGAMLAPGILLGLVGVLAMILGVVLPPSMAAGGLLLVFALALLVVGLIFAGMTLSKARRMGDV